MRFVKPLPPRFESVAGMNIQRIQLNPLSPRPIAGLAIRAVLEKYGKHQNLGARPQRRVISKFERLKNDPIAFLKILTQLTRPEPAHVEIIVDESVNRVGCSIFALHAIDRFTLTFHHEVIRMPTVASGNQEVICVCRDQNFLVMPEVEVRFRKQLLHHRLNADPDSTIRQIPWLRQRSLQDAMPLIFST